MDEVKKKPEKFSLSDIVKLGTLSTERDPRTSTVGAIRPNPLPDVDERYNLKLQPTTGSTPHSPTGFFPQESSTVETPIKQVQNIGVQKKINELYTPQPPPERGNEKQINALKTQRDVTGKANKEYFGEKGLQGQLKKSQESLEKFKESATSAAQGRTQLAQRDLKLFQGLQEQYALTPEQASEKIGTWKKILSTIGQGLGSEGLLGRAIQNNVPAIPHMVREIQNASSQKFVQEFQNLSKMHDLSMEAIDATYQGAEKEYQIDERMLQTGLDILKAKRETALIPAEQAKYDQQIGQIEQGIAERQAQYQTQKKQYEAIKLANDFGLITDPNKLTFQDPRTGNNITIVPRNEASAKTLTETIPVLSQIQSNLRTIRDEYQKPQPNSELINNLFRNAVAQAPWIPTSDKKNLEDPFNLIFNHPENIALLEGQLEQYARNVISTNTKVPNNTQDLIKRLVGEGAPTSKSLPASNPQPKVMPSAAGE